MLLDFNQLPSIRIVALDSSENHLSVKDILNLSESLSSKIPERSLVFILTENNVGGIAWVMALLLSGHVPFILSAHTETTLLDKLTFTYLPQHICVPDHMSAEYGVNPIAEGYGYKIYATDAPSVALNPELSHLLPTSGSTGSPKLVRHKYENIEAAALNISTFFGLKESDRPLMVLPLHYTMGLSMVFSHIKVGATILITDLSMTDPRFWQFLKEEHATSFTGVPFSYEILDKMRFTRMKLPDLTLLTQGGGKMPFELNLKFAEYCRDNDKKWIATYGQSEGTARMAWLPSEYAVSKIGSIGIAVPNGKLSLRDSEGNVIETSPATGEMCYEGKNVTMGYAQCREDLALGDERNGFLATGDIAYRDEDGFYFIKGRMGRFLKIFGNRIGLDECEQIVKSVITGECACTGNDALLIVYLTDSNDSERAKNALVEALHLPANAIETRVIDALPKSETSKTLYTKLKIHKDF